MGKKSVETLPDMQETIPDSNYLTPSETAGVTELERFEHLIEGLLQRESQKQMRLQTADRLLRLHSGWRQEDRDKYLREVSLWILTPYLCISQ